MKAQHILALLALSTSILSNSMDTKVTLPSAQTLTQYLNNATELVDWFKHDEHPEIGADIPKHFGGKDTSPDELKKYLWNIDTQLCERSGIMQPTFTHDEEITKTIFEIINLVFQDHPDLLKQINEIAYPNLLKQLKEIHYPSVATLMYMFKGI